MMDFFAGLSAFVDAATHHPVLTLGSLALVVVVMLALSFLGVI